MGYYEQWMILALTDMFYNMNLVEQSCAAWHKSVHNILNPKDNTYPFYVAGMIHYGNVSIPFGLWNDNGYYLFTCSVLNCDLLLSVGIIPYATLPCICLSKPKPDCVVLN